MTHYELKIAGLTRQLPIIKIADDLAIASFVILGDAEIVEKTAPELLKRLPEIDVIVTAEAKGIPLVYEISRLLQLSRYVVARKSVKVYMEDPFSVELDSITTAKSQKLYLAKEDVELVQGKRVAIIDDVISTGESLNALENLIRQAGGEIVAKAAILAEGDAAKRDDIIFLEELPLFPVD
ncbi:MAG: adenine phosphoribosyltransferase [Clostridiaceae bacterium]|jgi:adenine phosphoribosyltransferase|nr:adenine phosphoribosyltransferase [Clostridiaceae bacterium]